MIYDPSVETNANYVPPNNDELSRLLDYLFVHTREPLLEFFRDNGISTKGKKETLRERLEEQLADGVLSPDRLIALLDQLDGWGNQHVYLFNAPKNLFKDWDSESKAKKALRKISAAELLNSHLPLVLPEEPTLSSVAWSPKRVRFVWIEKRQYAQRREDLDLTESEATAIICPKTSRVANNRNVENIKFRAYEERVQRAVTSFEWDFATGQAALLIHQLPSGEKYQELRNSYLESLEAAIPVSDFDSLRVSRSIHKLIDSPETSNRQIEDATATGGQAKLTSRSKKFDINDDPALRKARQGLGKTSPLMGNFYWLEKEPILVRQIRTKIYAFDQRVGIFGECSEDEVKYVLSRIRFYCR